MADYRLSWRRKAPDNVYVIPPPTMPEVLQFIREHPGVRWRTLLPEPTGPVNYLEIGVYRGEHIIDMSKSYCSHPDSVIYCVDPWTDYDEYPEYKGEIESAYDVFMNSMKTENLLNKVKIYRDFSHNVVPKFKDNFFDIIFIDGNHETEFVYRDGVMALSKVKPGGTIVFDDYLWPSVKEGIKKFLIDHSAQVDSIRHSISQLFVNKK
jgi:hypothetical protein